jgi:hypothetical protein
MKPGLIVWPRSRSTKLGPAPASVPNTLSGNNLGRIPRQESSSFVMSVRNEAGGSKACRQTLGNRSRKPIRDLCRMHAPGRGASARLRHSLDHAASTTFRENVTSGGGCLAGSLPSVLVGSRECSRTPPYHMDYRHQRKGSHGEEG